MKESRFIAQNKKKWQESEDLLSDPIKDPEKLTSLFTQVVDDLSFSRTYYPNRTVRVYLNQLAREYFSIIYSNQKEKKNSFRIFWLDEIPQLMIFARKQMLISLAIFLLAVAVGVFSSMKDPQFSSAILGQGYVAMTKENIEKGDPMAVYKKGEQVDMFLGITLNNLRVAFITYVLGIFFAVGTLYILLSNGIMVGSFQYFFVDHGLLAKSALSIWLHGTLEMSSIILSGGAGLVLGSGILFPGTYSRFQSFQISAVRSLKLMLGIAPIFVLAAIIESFLTRYTEAPDVVKVLLILLSLGFIVGYFVIFPWRKSKAGFEVPLTETSLTPEIRQETQFAKIRNNAAILQEAFLFYRRNVNQFLPAILIVSTVVAAIIMTSGETVSGRLTNNVWTLGISDLFLALRTPDPVMIFVNATGASIILFRISGLLIKEIHPNQKRRFQTTSFLQTLLILLLMYAMIFLLGAWSTIILGFSYVLIIMVQYVQQLQNTFLPRNSMSMFKLLREGMSQMIGLEFVLLLLMVSFLAILSAPLLELTIRSLRSNFAGTPWILTAVSFIRIFTHILAFNLILPLVVACSAFLYFSIAEVNSADQLKRSITTIGDSSTRRSRR